MLTRTDPQNGALGRGSHQPRPAALSAMQSADGTRRSLLPQEEWAQALAKYHTRFERLKPMLKRIIEAFLIISGLLAWVLISFYWLGYQVLGDAFSTRAYDVSRRLTSPDGITTALLVRDYNFDLNFVLFIVNDSYHSASDGFRRALWASHDYNPGTFVNFHEDLEWSKDSSIIAVIINGQYSFAYDFITGKRLEDKDSIKSLLASRNKP